MEEFLHLYEMESLSLGITARKDVTEQVRRFFLGVDGANSAMQRTALALALALRRSEAKDADAKDLDDVGSSSRTLRLVVAGNSRECFRNRLRNIQLIALSNAVVRSRLSGIVALDFGHNYLGEEQGGDAVDAKPTDHDEAKRSGLVLDEAPFLLDAAPSLTKMLQSTALYTSSIEELQLSGNRIGPESCRLLCAALKDNATSLKKLDLSGNPLRVVGGHAIAELLTKDAASNCPLEELNVGNTELEVENIIAIATALRENRTLLVLCLDKPVVRSKEGEAIQHIGKMLQVNDTLRSLSLNKHQLTDDGAQVLAERLLDNHTLQRLTLRANSIGSTGASALAALLLRHDALAEFDLSANRICDAGALAFAKLLRHNTRPLSTLALCSTYLTNEGLAVIARACLEPRHPESNRLQNLLLWGNDFGESSARLFLDLHRGRFAQWDIETDFLATPSDCQSDEADAPSVQIAHRELRRAAELSSPKR